MHGYGWDPRFLRPPDQMAMAAQQMLQAQQRPSMNPNALGGGLDFFGLGNLVTRPSQTSRAAPIEQAQGQTPVKARAKGQSFDPIEVALNALGNVGLKETSTGHLITTNLARGRDPQRQRSLEQTAQLRQELLQERIKEARLRAAKLMMSGEGATAAINALLSGYGG